MALNVDDFDEDSFWCFCERWCSYLSQVIWGGNRIYPWRKSYGLDGVMVISKVDTSVEYTDTSRKDEQKVCKIVDHSSIILVQN